METTSCPHCVRPRSAADGRGLAWSSLRGPDGTLWFICPDCTRSQLPEIETGAGGLPRLDRSSAA